MLRNNNYKKRKGYERFKNIELGKQLASYQKPTFTYFTRPFEHKFLANFF